MESPRGPRRAWASVSWRAEQLVEGETIERGFGTSAASSGKCAVRRASPSARQLAALRIGQGILDRRQRRLEDAGEQLAQPLLGDAGSEVIDRHDARGVDRLAPDRAELRRRELRPPARARPPCPRRSARRRPAGAARQSGGRTRWPPRCRRLRRESWAMTRCGRSPEPGLDPHGVDRARGPIASRRAPARRAYGAR